MFARKLLVEIEENGTRRPCPMDWLDQCFMRHFTGLSALEETLPVADGRMEAGFTVSVEKLTEHFQQWLRGKKMITSSARVVFSELGDSA
jgi:hypothetical protein